MANTIEDDDQTKFWKSVKRGFRPELASHAKRVGDASNVRDILGTWKDHFSGLVNSEPPESVEDDRKLFEETLGSYMKKLHLPWWFVDIHPIEVEKAIGHLKFNKSPGPDGIMSEHLKYGGPALAIYLSVAFTTFLRHSFLPKEFLKSYIVPILKDKRGNISDPDNYREIAISSVVSKVFEHVLLHRSGDLWATGNEQFGFKKGHSCADCSFVLKQVVEYYLSNGNSCVYTCALDLYKAFDRVSYYQLFCKLLRRGTPIYIVKLLAKWYSSQSMQVKWDDCFSQPFTVGNGVRQGSVLSPYLFNVYLDDLLSDLRRSGKGARIGALFVGCLGYADDFTLVSPTTSGLQSLLDICESYVNRQQEECFD